MTEMGAKSKEGGDSVAKSEGKIDVWCVLMHTICRVFRVLTSTVVNRS